MNDPHDHTRTDAGIPAHDDADNLIDATTITARLRPVTAPLSVPRGAADPAMPFALASAPRGERCSCGAALPLAELVDDGAVAASAARVGAVTTEPGSTSASGGAVAVPTALAEPAPISPALAASDRVEPADEFGTALERTRLVGDPTGVAGPGPVESAGVAEAEVARRLAGIAATRLVDAPAAAEEQLRRALIAGTGLDARERAALHTQLVTAVAAQPGRDQDVARAAAAAAECWQPISAADAVHLWLVAGRAWHRVGHHAEAVAALDRPLLSAHIGYPPGELAQVRAEFAESLIRLGRYRQAAWQFTEAARLLAGSATDRHRHADLVWSAAVTRECCGQEPEAVAGYLRAAGLWADQDKIVPRAQCLRAAAWLQLRGDPAKVGGPWRTTVEDLLAELDGRLGADPAAHLVEERDRTRDQYARMCEQAAGEQDEDEGPRYADPLVWWESH